MPKDENRPALAPFRGARFLRRQATRIRKLAYWTMTGQLPRQLRDRREQIRARWDHLTEAVLLRFGRRKPMRDRLGLPPTPPTPDPEKLTLPTSDAPVLSIVIPTYGQVDYTLRCLASIAAHPPRMAFEVLVVDDASRDPRVPELRAVSGIRLIERAGNLGFLRSCNDAAKQARGEYLFLLNNDTEVMPGAVDALLDTFTSHPAAGIVGARLLYPDGWQQEAGGIVWRDGSAWNYGHNDDPRRPQYNYLRDADYISGAAIMLPMDLWRALGGFDEHYIPAYCEDSDLAFRVRAAGRRVLYQPSSVIIHHEGVSHGTDLSQGLKAHQVINAEKLRARWALTLAADHAESGTRLMRSRDRALHRRVTLVIDNNIPQPDRDAGSRTMVAFMEALLASGRVVKFWPLNGLRMPGYTEALQARGIEVLHSPWVRSFTSWITANGAEIDEVLLSRPHVSAETLPEIRAHTQATVVFYGHDLHHARLRREAEATKSPALLAEADRLLVDEREAWRGADLVLYPAADEVAVVRALEPSVEARSITPYALPAQTSPPPVPEGREGLLFVAGFGHPPNEDAACWLLDAVMPLIRAKHPGIALTLAGSNPTERVRALAAPDVEVTGFISDAELARRYARARVVVCPLRYGAGIKLKVVEALHQGVPIVTTTTGAQGLAHVEHACPITDDAAGFAQAVLRLLADDDVWRAQAAAQREFVGETFSAEAVRRMIEAAFTDAASRRLSASVPA